MLKYLVGLNGKIRDSKSFDNVSSTLQGTKNNFYMTDEQIFMLLCNDEITKSFCEEFSIYVKEKNKNFIDIRFSTIRNSIYEICDIKVDIIFNIDVYVNLLTISRKDNIQIDCSNDLIKDLKLIITKILRELSIKKLLDI